MIVAPVVVFELLKMGLDLAEVRETEDAENEMVVVEQVGQVWT